MGCIAMALALAALSSGSAVADAEWIFVAGTSHGGGTHLAKRPVFSLEPVPAAGGTTGATSDSAPRLASFAVGLAGDEGRVRGGGELSTIVGFGDDTAGYTAFVTYAGVTGKHIFVQAGLGLGSFWGTDHSGAIDRLAGDFRAELGVRIHDQWMVVGRGDMIVGGSALEPVATLGVQWMPSGRM